MNALMFVDFQLAKKQFRYGLLLAVLFSVMIMASSLFGSAGEEVRESIADLQAPIMAMVALMTGMMLMFGVFGADESGGWPETRLSLPVTKREVVTARYALMAITGAIVTAIGAIASAVVGMIAASILEGSAATMMTPIEVIVVAIVIAATLLFFFAIEIPIIFRYGITAARYSLAAFWLIPVAVTIPPVRSFLDMVIMRLDAISNYVPITVGFIVFVALLYFASMMLSVRIYSNREL